ncbi:MAG: hypothetical protein ACOC41_00525 [Chitinivibrionales bacterium]
MTSRVKKFLMVALISILSVGISQVVIAEGRLQSPSETKGVKKVDGAPAPVVDDSPINPVISDSSDDKSRKNETGKQKTKSCKKPQSRKNR